ncbi:MAG: hypothetical protein KKE44_14825 [Proteobacteria bacterium]|nr:hypothetical protein [Pseudomonadota bacterium]MBU1584002.1 hypothetical protein [Pseudomonadota bacterium]MBU2631484.1 hypothetical protein [Pseudomonadota bacterium]
MIKRKKKATEPQKEATKEKEDFLNPKSLLQVWKTFLKNIPAQFRRSILMYQPYIVIGEAGTGKSNLIDNYTDWKNQANQFYPSHTQDPLLQIYLGSRIVVQEVPAALLHDTSTPTRKALLNLWKRFKRKKDLTIVITLKGETLINGDPDSLKEQAQMIRGKINVLSEILKRPVKVRIALTFMNHVTGFTEFSAFMQKNNMPFELVIDNQYDLNDIDGFIKPYEQYLSNSLISETSNDYLKILSFCQTAPPMLSGLSRFIHIFTDPDPLSPSPTINRIFFTADTLTEDKPFSNPFKADISITKIRKYDPLKKHKLAAAALVIAGITYLLFSYHYKQNHTHHILASLERINSAIIETDQTDNELHDQVTALLDDFKNESEKGVKATWLIDFFPDAQKEINACVIKGKKNLQEKIIQTVLQPKLTQLKEQNDSYKKNLLILALIYASNANELGSFITENIDFWVTTCNIPRHIIEKYILISDASWNKVIPLKGLVDEKPLGNTNKHRSWLLFLNNIEKFQKQSFINPQTLLKLQKDALELVDELDDSLQTNWFDKLQGLIVSQSVLADHIIFDRDNTPSIKKDHTAFKRFLDFFWKLRFDFPEVKDINLEQLLENLQIMMDVKHQETQHFEFEINKTTFFFNSGELNDLITKSSMVMLLRNYVSYYARYPGFSFFQTDSEYENLVVGISSDDNFYFSKRAVIDGRYTKEVYEKQVMPVLKALPALLEKLPVSTTEKTHFSNFMFREVEAYTHNYIINYENYYTGFRIDADSVGELRYILTQMTLPLSQFQEFLMLLNENLSLEYGDNPYFDLIKSKFRPLGFIPLLMQKQKDEFPELEKYKAILRQILDDLLSDKPVAATADDNGLSSLKGLLSPEARIGVDIFLDGPESYLNIIQKWGTTVGIPEKWLYPFTEPVYQIYLLAQKKIEALINTEWENLRTAFLNPVLDQFPFNREATSPVTPEALKNLTYSSGEFWGAFSRVIAPLCKKGPDGNWQERPFAMSSLKFPRNMFKEVNHISHLSKIFFNDKGDPQPLSFDVKPHPLPLTEKKLMFVVLSYLRSGKNTVFGFNQQPSWHKFNLEWWKPESASAGVEFMEEPEKKGKIFSNITVPNSYWSFYRLLDKAQTPEPQTWMWDIQSPGDIQWKRAISFSIRNDPWIVFQKNKFDEKK